MILSSLKMVNFHRPLGWIFVAIHWLDACKKAGPPSSDERRLDDTEGSPGQTIPGETVNIGLVDGQVTKLRIS